MKWMEKWYHKEMICISRLVVFTVDKTNFKTKLVTRNQGFRLGLPWQFSGEDPALPMQGAWV